jgi:hypothetical protein
MEEIDRQLDAAAKADMAKEGEEKPTQPGDIRDENRESIERYGAGEFGSWLSGMPYAHPFGPDPKWAPYPTQGLALQYGQEGDEISADERRYMKKLGVDIPLGMTRTQFRRMFGTSLTGGNSARDEYMSRFADIKERALAQSAEHFKIGEARRQHSTYNVPTAVEDDFRSLVKAKYKLSDAGALRTKFEGQFGPIMSRWNNILSGLGVQHPRYSEVRSKLTQALGSFLTAETGAQRGMTEVRWLETALPRLIDSGANWDAVLKSFQKDLDRDIKYLYHNWGEKGKRVHQWERAMVDLGIEFEPITPGLASQAGGLNPQVANAEDQSPAPTSITAAPEVEKQRVYVFQPNGARMPADLSPEEQQTVLEQHPDWRIEERE